MQLELAKGYAQMHVLRAQGKPVVWRSLLVPREIFDAMDVATVYGDLLGGNVCVLGDSSKYCQIAEESGLSRDICAVHRCSIGLAIDDEKETGVYDLTFAPPDLVVGSSFLCVSYSRSCLHIARKFNAPHHHFDIPINTWGDEIPDHAIQYYVAELKRVIGFLEEHGYRFDLERLKEEVAFTKTLNTLLDEIDTYKRAVPAPMQAYDSVVAATVPLTCGRDKKRTLELYEKLRDELKDRVSRGEGVIGDEKLRLMWVGNPPLVDFELLHYPQKHGAVTAKSLLELTTGFTVSPDLIDPEHPFESIARAHISSPGNPTHHNMMKWVIKTAKDYKIDGVILNVKRSCGQLPGSLRIIRDEIREQLGLPTTLFNLEGSDDREYDPKDARANVDAFIETLFARAGE